MKYTQVELTDGSTEEVWWVPSENVKLTAGQEVVRPLDPEAWHISKVCTTLEYEDIPAGARIAIQLVHQTETMMLMRS